MSACCSTYGDVAGSHFNEAIARRDLDTYRRKGPGPTTRLLCDLIVDAHLADGALLDIGSGVGSLTFELLDRGIKRAVLVDASASYLAAAAEEATRRDRIGTVQFVQGDFLHVASQIPAAPVVTLDRVICCYPRYAPLLEESLRHAQRAIALSYPRNRWYVRVAIACENGLRSLKRNQFRAYVHPVDDIAETINRAGFRLASRRRTWQWSVEIWVRSAGSAKGAVPTL